MAAQIPVQKPVQVYIDKVKVGQLMSCTYSFDNQSSFTPTNTEAILQTGTNSFSLTIGTVKITRGRAVSMERLCLEKKIVTVIVPTGEETYEVDGIFQRAEGSSDNANGMHHATYTFNGVNPKIV